VDRCWFFNKESSLIGISKVGAQPLDDRRHTGSIFGVRESSQLADGSPGRSSSALKRDDQTTEESLELQCNLVITVGVIFKHGIDTTLLNIGSGQIWPGSQQR
jgi:hypothetical protein